MQAASPRVVLLAAPTEAKAGAAFAVAVRVRGATGSLRIVATSPHGSASALARRSGRTHRARLTVNATIAVCGAFTMRHY